MCFQKNIQGLVVHCCPGKTCVGEACVRAVLKVCSREEVMDTQDGPTGNFWVMLGLLFGILTLFVILPRLRRIKLCTASVGLEEVHDSIVYTCDLLEFSCFRL